MIRGVIFDLDGVLVSTDELHYRAWKQLADAEGIRFNRQINHRLRGVSRGDSLDIILERADREYPDDQKLALAERKNDRYRASLAGLTATDALPGAVEMLQALRRRAIRTAVASASRNAPLIMERVGLTGLVDAVVDGNDVSRAKPDPEVFLVAAERLGLAADECLVVEDALAGIEAGRRAGMAVVGIGTPDSLPGVEPIVAGLAGVTVEELLAAGD